MKKLSTLLLLFFIAVLSFGQDIEFAPKQKLFELPTSGLFALAYIPMDYNQDGITDYIGRDNDDGLIVQLGTENGFEVSDDITVEAFPYARPYDILDFNNDGFEDIIMEWYVYIYDPVNNVYNELFYEDAGELITVMAVADFDRNGHKDILTVLSSGSKQNDLSIYFYDGVDFEKVMLTDEIGIGPLKVGDLESDGDMDIAIIDKYNTSWPVILVNDGTGNFSRRYVLGSQPLYSRVLDFEDMDSDGDLDLLVFNSNHQFYLYENTDNFLTPPAKHLIHSSASPLSNVIADLNGDGNKEIISFNYTTTEFSVDMYTGKGDLKFEAKRTIERFDDPTFFIGLNPNYDQNTLRLRDQDQNGSLDLLLSYGAGEDPSVFLFTNLDGESSEETSSSGEIAMEEVNIYPNPVISRLYVSNAIERFAIFNNQGQLIKKGLYSDNIDVGDLQEGIYFLKLTEKGKTLTSSFSKVSY